MSYQSRFSWAFVLGCCFAQGACAAQVQQDDGDLFHRVEALVLQGRSITADQMDRVLESDIEVQVADGRLTVPRGRYLGVEVESIELHLSEHMKPKFAEVRLVESACVEAARLRDEFGADDEVDVPNAPENAVRRYFTHMEHGHRTAIGVTDQRQRCARTFVVDSME